MEQKHVLLFELKMLLPVFQMDFYILHARISTSSFVLTSLRDDALWIIHAYWPSYILT